jgi:hypothetical protein
MTLGAVLAGLTATPRARRGVRHGPGSSHREIRLSRLNWWCLGSFGCEISALTASFAQTRFEAALELLPALLFGFRAALYGLPILLD